MINQYITEWNLHDLSLDDSLDYDSIKMKIFESMMPRLAGTFRFSFNGIQPADKQSFLYRFKKETEWNFTPKDTSFNIFYGLNVDELGLILIFKDKSEGFNIKPNHLYCFPYWMTYKFLSQNEEKEQELIKCTFWSDSKVFNKYEKIYW